MSLQWFTYIVYFNLYDQMAKRIEMLELEEREKLQTSLCKS